MSSNPYRNDPPDGFDHDWWYYQMMYVKGQPYLVGILLGYIMFRMKGKQIKLHWVRKLGTLTNPDLTVFFF